MSWSSAVIACERAGQWQEAEALLESMEQQGVRPDTFTLNVIIRILAKAQQADKALALFDRLKREGYRPDKFSFGAALLACQAGAQGSRALELVAEMVHTQGLELDAFSLGAALGACEGAGLDTQARSLLDDARKRGITPFFHRIGSRKSMVDVRAERSPTFPTFPSASLQDADKIEAKFFLLFLII